MIFRFASASKDRNSQICDLKYGHEPQKGLDTKTDRLTGRQLQSNVDMGLCNAVSVTQTIQCRMTGWLVSNGLEEVLDEAAVE